MGNAKRDRPCKQGFHKPHDNEMRKDVSMFDQPYRQHMVRPTPPTHTHMFDQPYRQRMVLTRAALFFPFYLDLLS
jgi:hypothetical protein